MFGKTFAIPTKDWDVQVLPLPVIQFYVSRFLDFTKTKPNLNFLVTQIGCGLAGYKVEEIAPMFKSISRNVIFPASFRPFVEKTLPKLTKKLVHTFIQDSVIFSDDPSETIQTLNLTEAEKSLATIVINTPMYPEDSNGRDRTFEISDILQALDGKVFEFQSNSEGPMIFGGVILALMELYQFNERDFIELWNGEKTIAPPKPEHHAKR